RRVGERLARSSAGPYLPTVRSEPSHSRQRRKEPHVMPFEVPPLPYDYAALEPHIDAQTMQIHHDKHHQAYVDTANAALAGTDLADASVEDVLRNLDSLPSDKQTPVRNNAG